MLQIVAKNDAPVRRLTLARRHIETAISHINDVAQSRIPLTEADLAPGVDELRLIVRALADIREALKLSDYENLLRQRDDRRNRGELVGVGFSTFVEPSGGAGFESGSVRVERTGEITVLTGSSSHGQGHETSWAQIAAELLKTTMDHVTVLHGDTHVSQQGTGTFGSRSAVVGGGALAIASERIIEKAKRIAAHLVEAAPEDVVQADGGFAVSASQDKTVKVWDLETGTLLGAFTCDATPSVCVFATSQLVLAGDFTGQIHLLAVERGDLV